MVKIQVAIEKHLIHDHRSHISSRTVLFSQRFDQGGGVSFHGFVALIEVNLAVWPIRFHCSER